MRDQAAINAKTSRSVTAYWDRLRAAYAKAHPVKPIKQTRRGMLALVAAVEANMPKKRSRT